MGAGTVEICGNTRKSDVSGCFPLAFLLPCGMIFGFMNSEKQLPGKEAHSREADVYDLLAWFEVNKQKVAVIAVLAVTVGFAIAAYRYFAQQKELKASDALLMLKPLLIPPTNTSPAQASAFFKVADEFKGTSAAERAQFYGATVLYTENKYSEAETQFNRFLKEHEGSPWAAAATYGVAAAQEAQGKAEALASYQNVFARYPQSAEAEEAKLAVARIYEVRNQPEQALRIYNELTVPKPGATAATGTAMESPEIRQKKDALLRKYPNLATNAATAAASTLTAPLTLGSNASAVLSAGTNGAVKVATNGPAITAPPLTTTPPK